MQVSPYIPQYSYINARLAPSFIQQSLYARISPLLPHTSYAITRIQAQNTMPQQTTYYNTSTLYASLPFSQGVRTTSISLAMPYLQIIPWTIKAPKALLFPYLVGLSPGGPTSKIPSLLLLQKPSCSPLYRALKRVSLYNRCQPSYRYASTPIASLLNIITSTLLYS